MSVKKLRLTGGGGGAEGGIVPPPPLPAIPSRALPTPYIYSQKRSKPHLRHKKAQTLKHPKASINLVLVEFTSAERWRGQHPLRQLAAGMHRKLQDPLGPLASFPSFFRILYRPLEGAP